MDVRTGFTVRLGTALTAILDCAELELEEAGRTVPPQVFVAPGLAAFEDNCGQLWVRVIRTFPSSSPPDPIVELAHCPAPLYTEIGLGITRCQTGVHRMEQKGGHPLDSEQTFDALGLICDEGALYRALACCLPTLEDAPDLLIGEWSQLEPQGGVVGGEWTAFIETDLFCEPTSPGDSP